MGGRRKGADRQAAGNDGEKLSRRRGKNKMKNWTYRLIPAAVGLVLGIAPVTVLADFESGWKAYQSGDFATAISAWSPH